MSQSLPYSTPEAQGIPSTAILAMLKALEPRLADHGSIHAFQLIRHGHIVAEGGWAPYNPHKPHMLFSVTKSITGTAAGMAIAEGLFALDDPVTSYFSDELPAEVSPNLRAMKIRHLLAMATGHAQDPMFRMRNWEDGDWLRGFLESPVEHEPGTHWMYNNGAPHMISAIIQRLTGQRLEDYLRPRLFDPLGIGEVVWDRCPRGYSIGGFSLTMKTEEMARIAQVWAQHGMWRGQQLVPAAWIDQASRAISANGHDPDNDFETGYGYQFWICRHGAYTGYGAMGQYGLVMPEQDAVFAIHSGLSETHILTDLVWDILMASMQRNALPEDPATQAELQAYLGSRAMPLARGSHESATLARVAGRRYAFGENTQGLEWLAVEAGPDGGCTLALKDGRGEHRLAAGAGAWASGVTTFDGQPGGARKVMASAAWPAADALNIQLCFYESPHGPLLTMRFNGDEVVYHYQTPILFRPEQKREPIAGKAV